MEALDILAVVLIGVGAFMVGFKLGEWLIGDGLFW